MVQEKQVVIINGNVKMVQPHRLFQQKPDDQTYSATKPKWSQTTDKK